MSLIVFLPPETPRFLGHSTKMEDLPGQANSEKRRRRPPLACVACRRRKVRCDRKLPCQNCTRARRATSCAYVPDERLDPREGTQGDSDSTTGRSFDRGDVVSAPVGGGNRVTGNIQSKNNGNSNGEARTLRDKVRQLEKQLEQVLDAKRADTDGVPGQGIKLVPLPQRRSGSDSERAGDESTRESDGLRRPDFPMANYSGLGARPMLAKSRYLGGSHWMRGISLVSLLFLYFSSSWPFSKTFFFKIRNGSGALRWHCYFLFGRLSTSSDTAPLNVLCNQYPFFDRSCSLPAALSVS